MSFASHCHTFGRCAAFLVVLCVLIALDGLTCLEATMLCFGVKCLRYMYYYVLLSHIGFCRDTPKCLLSHHCCQTLCRWHPSNQKYNLYRLWCVFGFGIILCNIIFSSIMI